jgi:hypothetical protein
VLAEKVSRSPTILTGCWLELAVFRLELGVAAADSYVVEEDVAAGPPGWLFCQLWDHPEADLSNYAAAEPGVDGRVLHRRA